MEDNTISIDFDHASKIWRSNKIKQKNGTWR